MTKPTTNDLKAKREQELNAECDACGCYLRDHNNGMNCDECSCPIFTGPATPTAPVDKRCPVDNTITICLVDGINDPYNKTVVEWQIFDGLEDTEGSAKYNGEVLAGDLNDALIVAVAVAQRMYPWAREGVGPLTVNVVANGDDLYAKLLLDF